MKQKIKLLFFAATLTACFSAKTQTQQNPSSGAMIDDEEVLAELIITPASAATPLPWMIDNSQSQYAPAIVDQASSYSCAHAAYTGYLFSYEANRFRDEHVASNDDWEHMYSPGFSYNFINNGIAYTGSSFGACKNIFREVGATRASDYENGYYLKKEDDPTRIDWVRWKDTYDFYYKAMLNKPIFNSYEIDKSTDTLMIWKMKHWLNDHNAGSSYGGVFGFSAKLVFDDFKFGNLPPESYDGGKKYITEFSLIGGHAMIVVGYNDSVMVDIDSNGVFTNDVDLNGDNIIDVRDWEKGAFKVANSNGTWFANAGYVYVPYRLFALGSDEGGTTSGADIMDIQDFAAPPEMTLKIKANSNYRSKVDWSWSTTQSANDASCPVGWGVDYNFLPIPINDSPQDNNPFQGYSETIEFALDISSAIPDEPGKFIVRNHFSTTQYAEVIQLSLIDYRFNEVFEIENEELVMKSYDTTYAFPQPPDSVTRTIYYYDINYDLLPFTINANQQFNSDMVSRFNPTISGTATVGVNNAAIDFYNSNIIIESNALMNVNENVSFKSKRGLNSVQVHGNMTVMGSLESEVDIIIKTGGTLTLKDSKSLTLAGNARIIVEDGGKLLLEDNSTIRGESTANNIRIYGNLELGRGVAFADGASNVAWEGVILENPAKTYTFQEATFSKCKLSGTCNTLTMNSCSIQRTNVTANAVNATFSSCNFERSFLQLNNPVQKSASGLNVSNCIIKDVTDPDAKAALAISDYQEYQIKDNTIQFNNCDGIAIYRCGHGLKEFAITGNTISHSQSTSNLVAGIRLYDSYAEISGENIINSNEIGLLSLNNSNVTVRGNKYATFVSETQQICYNLDNQVHASSNSFPVYFRYNAVVNDNNAVPLVYYREEFPIHLDVRYNYWGNSFNPNEDLYPTELYEYLPKWPLESMNEDPGSDEQLYRAASVDMQAGDYPQAEAKCKQLVNQYPDSEFSKASLKLLLVIESLRNGNYNQLKNYYSNPQVQNNENIRKLAARLANQCNIKVEDYEEAIQWFEGVIQDPETLEDSIFAIIDLEYTYLLMENSGKDAGYVGKLAQFKPESREAFQNHRRELMNLLVGEGSNQPGNDERLIKESRLITNSPNPFSNNTSIEFKVEEPAQVKVCIYNIAGQKVLTLVDEYKTTGVYSSEIKASQLTEGIYLYTLELNGNIAERNKMVLMK